MLMTGFVEQLSFKDNSFDVAFHTAAINEPVDQGKAIKELLRVAKPGSRVMITDTRITAESAQQPIRRELVRAFPSINVPPLHPSMPLRTMLPNSP
ncbi:ubiquinone/menaquinone biosynthesis methyltransferase [Planctopirus ephydatiae]|uniref:Ubiquinone/menaquinone biosynthesis methyltransferase n=2 Tax=Planctopirus ephydatiae TaxID=2528019 RepID=A0A518GTI5_9PLAN|nr:ubiquinone/menaquinone biosynthesis methyltransferase [Planctopirus ephydatiae]